MIDKISTFVLPCVMCIVALCFVVKKDGMKDFSNGSYDGMRCCVELLPTLLLIMCSVNALFSSGLADLLCNLISPLLKPLNVPKALMPSVILRPFSGSAVTALADKLFAGEGADSTVSKIACLLMGSTDTVLYTLGMYMSSAKIKKTRYAVPASLIVFLFSVVFCCVFGNAVFR